MTFNEHNFGQGDNSYTAAGELAGITSLVDTFYSNMDKFSEAEKIRAMHPQDLTESRKKLTYFLSGWLGGPKLYLENYGSINIPGFHKYLTIGDDERDAWLLCMKAAINSQDYDLSFKNYLYSQLKIPAERVQKINSGNT
ncbi:MAG: group II truncated hemoglobin [Porticoccus sp.]|nr:group II truncated hemoglobin [Porticoccus sp.]